MWRPFSKHYWQYLWFWMTFCSLYFYLSISYSEIYFHPSKTCYTHPNDRWMDLYIGKNMIGLLEPKWRSCLTSPPWRCYCHEGCSNGEQGFLEEGWWDVTRVNKIVCRTLGKRVIKVFPCVFPRATGTLLFILILKVVSFPLISWSKVKCPHVKVIFATDEDYIWGNVRE